MSRHLDILFDENAGGGGGLRRCRVCSQDPPKYIERAKFVVMLDEFLYLFIAFLEATHG
jgi:hypothetical protein